MAQLAGVGGFAHQIEFVVQVFVEFGHHFARFQPLAVGKQALDAACGKTHQRQILLDDFCQIRAQHFHGHFFAAEQGGAVHLGDGGAGNGLRVESGIQFFNRLAQRLFDLAARQFGVKRRHFVLQFGQFGGIVGREQVGAGGEHLAEFHENGSEVFQRQAQAHGQGLVGELRGSRQPAHDVAQPVGMDVGQEHIAQAVAVNDFADGGKTGKPFHGEVRRVTEEAVL